MEINEIRERLRAYAQAVPDGSDAKFGATRLESEISLVQLFKSAGRYREAKYTANFVRDHMRDLDDGKEAPSIAFLLESVGAYIDAVISLPDTESTEDRSAAIVWRRDVPSGPELYPAGSMVRVASKDVLEEFKRTWKFHHPLREAQLKYSGLVAKVRGVGYYHGGDALYTLDRTSDFVWHEQCLGPVDATRTERGTVGGRRASMRRIKRSCFLRLVIRTN